MSSRAEIRAGMRNFTKGAALPNGSLTWRKLRRHYGLPRKMSLQSRYVAMSGFLDAMASIQKQQS